FTTMQDSIHGPSTPRHGGVVELGLGIHGRDEDTGDVRLQAASYDTVGAHEKAGPATLPRTGVGAADPYIVVGGRRMHGRWLDDFRDSRAAIEFPVLRSHRRLRGTKPLGIDVPGVVGVEHELHPSALVLTVQLGEAIVVADEGAATNP